MKVNHGKFVLVTNILNGDAVIYPSIKQAAIQLSTSSTNISRQITNKSIMFDLYLIIV